MALYSLFSVRRVLGACAVVLTCCLSIYVFSGAFSTFMGSANDVASLHSDPAKPPLKSVGTMVWVRQGDLSQADKAPQQADSMKQQQQQQLNDNREDTVAESNGPNTVAMELKADVDPDTRGVGRMDELADAFWTPLLRNATVLRVEPFRQRQLGAYADKWIAWLEGGYKAMIKVVNKHSLFDRSLRIVEYDPVVNDGTVRADSGEYQALPEIAAYHAARVMKLRGKQPIVGRILPSSLLYPSVLNYIIPSHQVAVAMFAWVDGLKAADPSPRVLDALSFRRGGGGEKLRTLEYLGDVSDTLVFDFIVDDHDRKAEKNWVVRDNRVILWDSGLAFNHGPLGRSHGRCLDILCGSNKWRKSSPRYQATGECDRICRFRRTTIDALHAMGPNALEEARFSSQYIKSLRNDPLFPLFDLATYYSDASEHEMVHYEASQFFYGLDQRVGQLLDHVDKCIKMHGREKVLSL